jgi:hypothetical protein
MPRYGLDTGFPASNPLAPLHADPVARAIGPGAIGTDLTESSWGGPSSFGSSSTTPLPTPHPEAHRSAPVGDVPSTPRGPRITCRPKAPSVPGRFAAPLAGCGLPRTLRTLQQVSVSRPTRRRQGLGLTRRPPRLPVTFADSSLLSASRRSPTARFEVAVNTVHVPSPLPPRERCGLGRSPLLTAPVGVRSPERASVKTPENPRSRGIFKFTGLSPKLSRYPQDSSRRPPVAHRSCTTMCTARHRSRRMDCIRRWNRVQWSPMTNHSPAAIIIIL